MRAREMQAKLLRPLEVTEDVLRSFPVSIGGAGHEAAENPNSVGDVRASVDREVQQRAHKGAVGVVRRERFARGSGELLASHHGRYSRFTCRGAESRQQVLNIVRLGEGVSTVNTLGNTQTQEMTDGPQ